MQTTARRLRRRLAFLVVGVAAFLAVAGSAMAAPTAPTGLSSTPASPTNAAGVTLTWTRVDHGDLGFAIVRYEWYVNGAARRRDPSASGPVSRTGPIALAEGTHSIKVEGGPGEVPPAPLDESGTDSAPLADPRRSEPRRRSPARPVGTELTNGWYICRPRRLDLREPRAALGRHPTCPADQDQSRRPGPTRPSPATVSDNARQLLHGDAPRLPGGQPVAGRVLAVEPDRQRHLRRRSQVQLDRGGRTRTRARRATSCGRTTAGRTTRSRRTTGPKATDTTLDPASPPSCP